MTAFLFSQYMVSNQSMPSDSPFSVSLAIEITIPVIFNDHLYFVEKHEGENLVQYLVEKQAHTNALSTLEAYFLASCGDKKRGMEGIKDSFFSVPLMNI